MPTSSPLWPYLPTLARLALALALGLFIGLERERRGKEAGLRTFAFAAVLGAVGGLLGERFALLALGLLGVLVVLLNIETIRTGEGAEITTSGALLVTGFIGVLAGLGHAFTPTALGEYRLFCAEYCGTKHSGMVGRVVVMEPADYQAWLSGSVPGMSLASRGERLFSELACNTCHLGDGRGRGPSLVNKFGASEPLASGGAAPVDEAYVRESILRPQSKIVAGYQPLMPTFQGLVSEENVMALVEYVKSLGATAQAAAPAATHAEGAAPGAVQESR